MTSLCVVGALTLQLRYSVILRTIRRLEDARIGAWSCKLGHQVGDPALVLLLRGAAALDGRSPSDCICRIAPIPDRRSPPLVLTRPSGADTSAGFRFIVRALVPYLSLQGSGLRLALWLRRARQHEGRRPGLQSQRPSSERCPRAPTVECCSARRSHTPVAKPSVLSGSDGMASAAH